MNTDTTALIALWTPIAVYMLFLVFATLSVVSKGEASTAENYSVGNRQYGAIALFATIAATMIGPSYSIGAVEKAANEGFFYMAFFSLAMIQILIFGAIFAAKMHTLGQDRRSLGDIMREGYGKLAQIFTGIATLGQSLAFSGVLCLGGAEVLYATIQLPVIYGTAAIAVIVSFYTMVGGLPAVVKTDKVQFYGLVILMILGCVALFSLPKSPFSTEHWIVSEKSHLSQSETIALIVAFTLGEAFIPIYAVRGIIGVTAGAVRKGFVSAAIFGIVWFILLGLFGVSYTANIGGHPSTGIVLLDYVLAPFSDPIIRAFITGLFAVALMGVVMSTFDSVLNAGAVSVIRDIVRPLSPKLTDAEEFSLQKIAVVAIGIFGVGITSLSNDIVQILLWGYTIWVPTAVAPLAYLIFRNGKVRSRFTGVTSIVCGALGRSSCFAWL